MKKVNRMSKKKTMINNLVVVSDLHCGCQMGLCPPEGVKLDGGGMYYPSDAQINVWNRWCEFWDEWIPDATKGEPFSVVVNGDALDGVHHGSVHQITHNLADQSEIARQLLAPIVDVCEGRFYGIRGTEAHVGPSGQEEEKLYRQLGAIPDSNGNYARWELWKRVGKGLVHITHHIGSTGSTAYESSALMREITESYVDCGRWNQEPPDVIIRSHRHRAIEIRLATGKGEATVATTAGWQLKTPFVFKIPGGRQTQPQLGGLLVRDGERETYTLNKVWSVKRPDPEIS